MSLISGKEENIFAKDVIGNVRKAQEDSHGWKLGTPNGDLFVVCDGMGGHVGGATASRIAVDSIIEHIDKEKYATPVEALDGALQFANMQIFGHAETHPELKGMGTTACILLLHDDGAWIAHVGDSRIYLYLGKEKQLHRITKDHSFVQTLVDNGEISDEEAEHHPNKNRIMKALGIKPELKPSFNFDNKPIHPKNGDFFLICSDGLSGMIPDRTIEYTLGEKLSLHEKGNKLVALAMQGETVQPGGQDNCTLELIKIDNSRWRNSEFKSYNPDSIAKRKPSLGKILFILFSIIVTLYLLCLCVTWSISPKPLDIKNARDEVRRIKDDINSATDSIYVIKKQIDSISSAKEESSNVINLEINALKKDLTYQYEKKNELVEDSITAQCKLLGLENKKTICSKINPFISPNK